MEEERAGDKCVCLCEYVRVCARLRACVCVHMSLHLSESSDCGISWSMSVCFMNNSTHNIAVFPLIYILYL